MKTKKNLLFLMAMAIVSVLSACTSEEQALDKQKIPAMAEEGIPTYATFTFQIDNGETDTRAIMLTDASETDAVNNIRLLIFDVNSGVNQVNKVSIDGSPLTVLLNSGDKRVFIIANAENNPDIRALVDNTAIQPGITTYNNFRDIVYDLGNVGNLSVPTNIDKLSNLVSTMNGYIMTNDQSNGSRFHISASIDSISSHNATGNDPSRNHFLLLIQRTVAKVSVYYDGSQALQLVDQMGRLQNLKFSLQNVNRSLYLFKQFSGEGDRPLTPNNPESFFDSTQSFLYNNPQFYPYGDPRFAVYFFRGYGFTNDVLSSYSEGNAVYVSENNPIPHVEGARTFVAIEADYIPNLDRIVDNFSFTPAVFMQNADFTVTHPTSFTPGADLFFVSGYSPYYSNTPLIFTDSIKAYKAAYCINNNTETGFNINNVDDLRGEYDASNINRIGGHVVKYTGGKAYYRINLRQSFVAGQGEYVLRNTHYRIKMVRFEMLGDPSLEDLYRIVSKVEVGRLTYVTASISIDNWVIDDYSFNGN